MNEGELRTWSSRLAVRACEEVRGESNVDTPSRDGREREEEEGDQKN